MSLYYKKSDRTFGENQDTDSDFELIDDNNIADVDFTNIEKDHISKLEENLFTKITAEQFKQIQGDKISALLNIILPKVGFLEKVSSSSEEDETIKLEFSEDKSAKAFYNLIKKITPKNEDTGLVLNINANSIYIDKDKIHKIITKFLTPLDKIKINNGFAENKGSEEIKIAHLKTKFALKEQRNANTRLGQGFANLRWLFGLFGLGPAALGLIGQGISYVHNQGGRHIPFFGPLLSGFSNLFLKTANGYVLQSSPEYQKRAQLVEENNKQSAEAISLSNKKGLWYSLAVVNKIFSTPISILKIPQTLAKIGTLLPRGINAPFKFLDDILDTKTFGTKTVQSKIDNFFLSSRGALSETWRNSRIYSGLKKDDPNKQLIIDKNISDQLKQLGSHEFKDLLNDGGRYTITKESQEMDDRGNKIVLVEGWGKNGKYFSERRLKNQYDQLLKLEDKINDKELKKYLEKDEDGNYKIEGDKFLQKVQKTTEGKTISIERYQEIMLNQEDKEVKEKIKEGDYQNMQAEIYQLGKFQVLIKGNKLKFFEGKGLEKTEIKFDEKLVNRDLFETISDLLNDKIKAKALPKTSIYGAVAQPLGDTQSKEGSR